MGPGFLSILRSSYWAMDADILPIGLIRTRSFQHIKAARPSRSRSPRCLKYVSQPPSPFITCAKINNQSRPMIAGRSLQLWPDINQKIQTKISWEGLINFIKINKLSLLYPEKNALIMAPAARSLPEPIHRTLVVLCKNDPLSTLAPLLIP